MFKSFISNIICLSEIKHLSKYKKLEIALKYLEIVFKYKILENIFNFKFTKQKIFKFEITAFRYKSIYLQFKEIFCKQIYYFENKKKNILIFDIGSNIGLSCIFFKILYPNSKIFCFEPDKDTFNLLKYNIYQNKLNNVYAYNIALSNKTKRISFFINKQIKGFEMMSTKNRVECKNKIFINAISISKFMNDNHIKYIDMLKSDTEGSENEILESLYKNKMLNKIKQYIIEYHHNISYFNKSKLNIFLNYFEKNNFKFQLDTNCIPISQKNKFQDILFYFYKNDKK